MKKENKWLGRMCKGILFSGIAFFLLVFASLVVPAIVGGMAPGGASATPNGSQKSISAGVAELKTMVSQLLATFSFFALVLVGVFSIPGVILSLIEISKAGNAGGWKAVWALITVFLSGIGILAYWYIGRKSLIQSSP